jgi:multiple sugar transport system permease protein
MTTTYPDPINRQTPAGGRQIARRIVLPIAVVLTVLFCLAPIIWQLLTSLKTNGAIASIPTIYFPNLSQLTLDQYQKLFERRPFFSYILNSAIVSFASTILALGVGSPAAYALARLRLQGRKIILAAVLLITLFPPILLFLGLLEIVRYLNLGNNYLALIIPYTAINLPLTILVMRSFFQQIPKDLEDAARVDGYSIPRMLLEVVLPMTIPALVTTGILAFIAAWNEFIFALTFITREDLKTVPVAGAQLGGASPFEIPYGPIAAATVLGTLPLVLLVLFFQRRIVQGLTAGAVKG